MIEKVLSDGCMEMLNSIDSGGVCHFFTGNCGIVRWCRSCEEECRVVVEAGQSLMMIERETKSSVLGSTINQQLAGGKRCGAF